MLRRQRVWIVYRNAISKAAFSSWRDGERLAFLKDEHRADTIAAWDLDKRRATFWHRKSEAEAAALMVAVKFPQFVGALRVTHRVRRTQW